MPKLSCRLISHSVGQHEQQIYTGLLMLHRRGLVDVTQEIVELGKVVDGGGGRTGARVGWDRPKFVYC